MHPEETETPFLLGTVSIPGTLASLCPPCLESLPNTHILFPFHRTDPQETKAHLIRVLTNTVFSLLVPSCHPPNLLPAQQVSEHGIDKAHCRFRTVSR